ncbi:MAG: glutathione S-transferase [Pseudomonadota bacterium]
MTYVLAIGDYTYSSWSLRGWLLFEAFSIPFKTQLIDFSAAAVADQLGAFRPARTVPAMKLADGTVIGDSLAIGEELASRHPEQAYWPADPTARSIGRSLAAEMHSSFTGLRSYCPMNLRQAYSDVPVDDGVQDDLKRLEQLWSWARAETKPNGPWLIGDYSIADVFFAPVAARIAGYGLQVGPEAQAYVSAHLAHAPFRRWRAMGFARGAVLPRYAKPYSVAPWPGPKTLAAEPVTSGPSENALCPYSGTDVTHFLQVDGRVFGFCNAFCRDKTIADPLAWDSFRGIYQS